MNHKSLGRFTVIVALAGFAAIGGLSPVRADSGPDHRAAQARPISLGTSGGNINDISTLYCCSGTLGSLVVDGSGTQYVLSNNHVIALSNAGSPGDPVNQPGMIDQSCRPNGIVANLSDYVPIRYASRKSIPLNRVDAAIAAVTPGDVRTDGSILDIGTISSDTMSAFVNQSVQKSGRTTGRTTGTVTAIDVTVDVGYSSSCGGAANQKARYVNQMTISPGAFSAGGDSGSLIVENGTVNPADGRPRAVGLLFAGSSSYTIANPIAPVLSLLGVQMVGGPALPATTGTVSGAVLSAADNSPISGAEVSADTGQTTQTDGAGAYTLTTVPTGTRTVSASAVGFVTDLQNVNVTQNTTATANFALDVSVGPSSVGVGCVTYTNTGSRGRDLRFTIRVLDDFGNPVSGAGVNIAVTLNGSSYGTGTGALSNSNGQASYTSSSAPNGTYSVTVTNITAAGLTFNAGSTPANSFRKGTDSSPMSFCNAGASPSDTSVGPDRGRNTTADFAVKLSRARAAKARNSERLMGLRGVQGHGLARGENGDPVIEVYVSDASATQGGQIPATIENIPVRVVVTGEFTAY